MSDDATGAALVECRVWLAVLGTIHAVVVAATKEDARVLAAARFADHGHRYTQGMRVRPATLVDVERHERALRQTVETVRRSVRPEPESEA